jgi:hypothetical protein
MGLATELAGDAVAAATGGPVAWALKHWKMIAGGLAFLGLVVALLIAKGDARHWEKVAGRNHDLLVEERFAHATTIVSLRQARRQIDDNNRRILEAAARLDDAKRQAAADQARADERWRGTQSTIGELEADARRSDRKPCTISPAARAALEDL